MAAIEHRDLEALRNAIRIGDASGADIPAIEVFAELRKIIADRQARNLPSAVNK